MAATVPGDRDSVPGFRFAVEIQGIAAGWFTECGGLTVQRGVRTYEEGGQNAFVHQLPGPISHARVTLKRGVVDATLWAWFTGAQDEGLYESKVAPRDVAIVVYGPDHTEIRRWNLARALPVKWSGPSLTAGDAQVAVETLELAQGDAGGSGAVQRAVEAEPAGATEAAFGGQDPDLAALARRVYALLRDELRVEHQRRSRSR
jgi:phage tail-like protein